MAETVREPVHFDQSIDENEIESAGIEALKTVRPQWDPTNIKAKVLSGGITNKLVCFYEDGKFGEDTIVIRVYGQKTDLIIDRDSEKKNMVVLSKKDICPPLYAIFNNALMYGFASGMVLDEKTVRDSHIGLLITRALVKLQLAKSPEESSGSKPKSELFDRLDDWLQKMPENFDDPVKQEKFSKHIKPRSVLESELATLKEHLGAMECPIVYAHNDLLVGNIIYNEKSDKVTFIDHEYGMFNYQPFDIGNHFCEFAGLDEVDYNLYPDKEFQMGWLRTYLKEWNKANGKSADILQAEVETLYVYVNKCALTAHFFWGVWALIQAKYSTIDFDYLEYGVIRFGEYFRRKEEFLSLQVPSK
ncbi:ethanolamine kinase 1-like [Mizuhopecten yessoensis]|uniref:ethanolamine kinase n=1 Tax=Mizuhopecten yessoensis TaxID=6573 RepID=A0A210Q2T4_MIZYE|nr:ethanolamine kinase 1-like [Mizuhopecten yessoensis]XP_021368804.1 ethanolamine kinase 1-like [Mizuhopecten yessoensis]XP_021368805.1 ethanolamine kinase 1-like [Mizuhopecten yessoensis]OWF43046.1 Ethanolamine kinase 1 [Mizuhopecten yessoensis]